MTSEQAAARAGLYRLLAMAFDYPRREFLDALQSGEYQDALASSGNIIGIRATGLPAFEGGSEELEATYLQMFELGRDGIGPYALREGGHINFDLKEDLAEIRDGQPSLLEDLLRFYHYFGLRLSEDPAQKLPPDHLVCQLEMLSHLSLLESRSGLTDEIASGYRDAQRDFLQRHVTAWLPKVHHKLKGVNQDNASIAFYSAVVDLALVGVTAHLEYVSKPLR